MALAVCQHLGQPRETVQMSQRGRSNLARSLATYVASQAAGFSNPEIREYFAFRTDSAVTKTCNRTLRLIEQSPPQQQLLRAVLP